MGLGLLGLGDSTASLVDDRECGVTEAVVRFEFDDFLGVLDRFFGFGHVGIELGEHAVADGEPGSRATASSSFAIAPGLSPWSRRSVASS